MDEKRGKSRRSNETSRAGKRGEGGTKETSRFRRRKRSKEAEASRTRRRRELVGADRERLKLLIEDSDEEEIKDFWGLQEKKEQAAGKGQLEKEKLKSEVSE